MKLNDMSELQAKLILKNWESGGHFRRSFLKAMYLADVGNLCQIYYAFPDLAVAMCIHHGLEYKATNSNLFIL